MDVATTEESDSTIRVSGYAMQGFSKVALLLNFHVEIPQINVWTLPTKYQATSMKTGYTFASYFFKIFYCKIGGVHIQNDKKLDIPEIIIVIFPNKKLTDKINIQ